MSKSNRGDCYVVMGELSTNSAILFGRNSLAPDGEVHEVVHFPSSAEPQTVECDGGANVESASRHAIILNRPVGLWGGESGSNEKGVVVGCSWSENEPSNEDGLRATDIVRLALERSQSAEEAVNEITSLTNNHNSDSIKFSFVICDRLQVWLLSIVGKFWAAERMESDYRSISSTGLNVTTVLTKTSENLLDQLKESGIWDGTDNFNFAKLFCSDYEEKLWPNPQPELGPYFTTLDMIAKLRSSDTDDSVRSSHVSHLDKDTIAVHWFTATPFPRQSVFKPFVFSANPKISPLTKMIEGEKQTMLQKLHSQRNWEKIGPLLMSLEETCYTELNLFIAKHKTPHSELDELMKDCVEAEVKFYR